jgi:hypothetical protein
MDLLVRLVLLLLGGSSGRSVLGVLAALALELKPRPDAGALERVGGPDGIHDALRESGNKVRAPHGRAVAATAAAAAQEEDDEAIAAAAGRWSKMDIQMRWMKGQGKE